MLRLLFLFSVYSFLTLLHHSMIAKENGDYTVHAGFTCSIAYLPTDSIRKGSTTKRMISKTKALSHISH